MENCGRRGTIVSPTESCPQVKDLEFKGAAITPRHHFLCPHHHEHTPKWKDDGQHIEMANLRVQIRHVMSARADFSVRKLCGHWRKMELTGGGGL